MTAQVATEVEAVVLGQEVVCGLLCTGVRLPTVEKILIVMIDSEGLDSSIVLDVRNSKDPWPGYNWAARLEVIAAAAAHRAAVFALMAEQQAALRWALIDPDAPAIAPAQEAAENLPEAGK